MRWERDELGIAIAVLLLSVKIGRVRRKVGVGIVGLMVAIRVAIVTVVAAVVVDEAAGSVCEARHREVAVRRVVRVVLLKRVRLAALLVAVHVASVHRVLRVMVGVVWQMRLAAMVELQKHVLVRIAILAGQAIHIIRILHRVDELGMGLFQLAVLELEQAIPLEQLLIARVQGRDVLHGAAEDGGLVGLVRVVRDEQRQFVDLLVDLVAPALLGRVVAVAARVWVIVIDFPFLSSLRNHVVFELGQITAATFRE